MRPVHLLAINNTILASQTTAVTFRYGYSHFEENSIAPSAGLDLASLGFPATFVNAAVLPKMPSGLVEGVGAAELDVPVYKVSSLTGDADYCRPFERQEFLSRCYVHPNANTAMGEIKGRP